MGKRTVARYLTELSDAGMALLMAEQEKKEMLLRMEREARIQLLHYYDKSAKEKLKELIKRAAGRHTAPKSWIFWPTGLLVNAFAENLEKCEKKEEALQALGRYFDRWITKGMPIHYVDDALCGEALLFLYEDTHEERYRMGADKLAEYLMGLADKEADRVGSIPYRPKQKNRHVYVDGIGMMCPFLAAYGSRFGNERAIELSLSQISNMLKYGMDAESGLPYHGFLYENQRKYGIIGWGRAVGWLLLGMSGVLRYLGADACGEIAEEYQKIINIVKKYQKENGAFCWQLPAKEGPEDSSATAMIACAVLRCENKNDSMKTNQLVSRAAEYLAGCEKDGKIMNCSGECKGFSEYPQIYGAYPWSLGPALSVFYSLKGREK